jgi:hypothetical protein
MESSSNKGATTERGLREAWAKSADPDAVAV